MLFVRPSPVLGESWASYLRHCAAQNSYKSIKHMARGLGLRVWTLIYTDPRIIGRRYELPFQFVANDLAALKVRSSKPTHMFRSPRTRVCSVCLRNGLSRLPSVWERPMSLVCDIHRVLLLDRCPTCGSEISTYRSRSQFCVCGADFGRAPARAAPPWIGTLENVFETGKLAHRCLTFGGDRTVEANAWARLGAFAVLRDGAVLTGRRLCIDDILESGPLFERWPDAFVAAVTIAVKANWSDRWALCGKLGGRSFPSIATAFKSVFLPMRRSVPIKRVRQRKRREIFSSFRRDEHVVRAAEKLGLAPLSLIRILVKQNFGLGPPLGLDKDAIRLEGWRQAVASFTERTGKIIRKAEAANMLGCSTLMAQRLSSEGLIRVHGANVGSVLISSAAIGELLARMRASADGKTSRVHSRVCFSDLLATKSAFHMSLRFADLVASIESSELPLYLCGGRDGYQLDDFYCKRADIEGWKRKYRVSAGGRSSP